MLKIGWKWKEVKLFHTVQIATSHVHLSLSFVQFPLFIFRFPLIFSLLTLFMLHVFSSIFLFIYTWFTFFFFVLVLPLHQQQDQGNNTEDRRECYPTKKNEKPFHWFFSSSFLVNGSVNLYIFVFGCFCWCVFPSIYKLLYKLNPFISKVPLLFSSGKCAFLFYWNFLEKYK